MSNNNDFFCPLPWIHLATHPNGNVSLCCKSADQFIGTATTNDKVLNICNDSIKELVNSDTFKKVRLDFLQSKIPTACKICLKSEKKNVESNRTLHQKLFPLKRDEAQKITETDGSITPNFRFIELRLGNKCNLKCVTCNPSSSSLWEAEKKNLSQFKHVLKYPGFDSLDQSFFKWPERKPFWKELHSYSGNVEKININGGEPTIIDDHTDYLQHLIQTKQSLSIELLYNINGTLLPTHLIKIWKQFKNIILQVSIDDIFKRNDYIRFPSKWDIISQNLLALKADSFNVEIIQTVSCLNFPYLDELPKWIASQNLSIPVSLNFVETPSFLSPLTIPPNDRKIIIKKMLLNGNFDSAQKVYKLYFNDQHNSENLLKLNDYIDILDNTRNTSFKNTFPKLHQILNNN